MNNIYNNPSLSPLKINSNILWKLLLTCTTEVPFYDHLGNIYVQTDGVSMGSVLGPIFSNWSGKSLDLCSQLRLHLWCYPTHLEPTAWKGLPIYTLVFQELILSILTYRESTHTHTHTHSLSLSLSLSHILTYRDSTHTLSHILTCRDSSLSLFISTSRNSLTLPLSKDTTQYA